MRNRRIVAALAVLSPLVLAACPPDRPDAAQDPRTTPGMTDPVTVPDVQTGPDPGTAAGGTLPAQ
jgi:hypothetical protein